MNVDVFTASAWCNVTLLTESQVWRGGKEEELYLYLFYSCSDGLLKRQDPQIALTDPVLLVRDMYTLQYSWESDVVCL